MNPSSKRLNRREFLRLLGLSGAAAALAACQPTAPSPTKALPPTSTIAPTATLTPAPAATALPSATATAAPTATATASPTPAFPAVSAIGQAQDYNPVVIHQELTRMFDGLGGLADVVRPGAVVAIKTNLTGGIWWESADKPPGTELFATHPAVVGALGELLIDAGASRIYILDGLGDPRNFDYWGYTEIARPLGAELIDVCEPAPYGDFVRYEVGPQAQVFDHFYLNALLSEIDTFISVAKLKVHSVAGVTLALKNLFGLPPIRLYRNDESHNHRSGLHGDSNFDTRVPRVILDLNRARPVHLAVLDGIYTADGGAGPWDAGLSQVKPGLLVASKDPVACDSVGAALMGFDPQAASGSLPFIHCENYLALAEQGGLGIHQLAQIGIAGPAITDVAYPFKPAG